MKAERIVLEVQGMNCRSCEQTIQRVLTENDGISKVKVDYAGGTVNIQYFPDIVSKKQIADIIHQAGYEVALPPESKRILLLKTLMLLAIMIIFYQLLSMIGVFSFVPEIQTGSSLFVIFLVGVLTSVHCVAMCGGISLAAGAAKSRARINEDNDQLRKNAAKKALLYNSGRIVSYTITGAIAGLLGQVISISSIGRNAIMVFAGIFMLIMGLNILGLTPWVRKIRLPVPEALVGVQARMSSNSIFWVGLFNGLMPCGPLQMMQLYALGTGSVLVGALSMMLFALGTTPLMFGISFFAGIMTGRKKKTIRLASAFLVILLGIQMMGRAIDIPMLIQSRQTNKQIEAAEGTYARVEDGYQLVETRFQYGRYQPIVVQAGLPVRWIITAQEGDLNGCNYSLLIDEYGIAQDLQVGETIIEFLPEETGLFRYTCWMNMISSQINVVSSLES